MVEINLKVKLSVDCDRVMPKEALEYQYREAISLAIEQTIENYGLVQTSDHSVDDFEVTVDETN